MRLVLGGCHYAIVLDVLNSKSNSQLTVVPMKSKRAKPTSYGTIYHLDLHEEVPLQLTRKSLSIINEETLHVQKLIERYDADDLQANPDAIRELARSKRLLEHAQRIREFADNKLNHESIADVGQICTVSKIRIMHPTKKQDVLYDVLLSDGTMSKIEEKIRQLYFSNQV